jgi:D-serine deaminase-like pyridoxal phosphate-dependent protein
MGKVYSISSRGQATAEGAEAQSPRTEQASRRLAARALVHAAWDAELASIGHSSERVARTLDVTETVVVKQRKGLAPVDIGDLVLVSDKVFEATVELLRKLRAA